MTQKEIFELLWNEAVEINNNGTIVRQIISPDFSRIADKILQLNKANVISSLPSECLNGWEKSDYCVLTGSCKKCS